MKSISSPDWKANGRQVKIKKQKDKQHTDRKKGKLNQNYLSLFINSIVAGFSISFSSFNVQKLDI